MRQRPVATNTSLEGRRPRHSAKARRCQPLRFTVEKRPEHARLGSDVSARGERGSLRHPAGRAPGIIFFALAIDWVAKRPTESHLSLEGTLVFVDVSGFTALTERLAAGAGPVLKKSTRSSARRSGSWALSPVLTARTC